MKIRHLILFILLLAPGLAKAATIETVDGKQHRDVYFKEVTANGLVFYFRQKTITFKPEEISPKYRKLYADKIEKYKKLSGANRDDSQQKFDAEIDKMKRHSPSARLLPLASVRKFYTRGKYKNAKINFKRWEQEVRSGFRDFEQKALDMEALEALLKLEQLKIAYQQYDILTSDLKRLHAKLSSSAMEQYAGHMKKLKTLDLDQKLEQAKKLYKVYKDLPVDRNELTTIIRDCTIEKQINLCKDTSSHESAISIMRRLISANPTHPRVPEMKQIIEKQEFHLQAKKDFAFLVTVQKQSKASLANLIRIMQKAVKVYADTPYAANAQKHLTKWIEIKAEKERVAREQRERAERAARERAERQEQYRKQGWGSCDTCGGSGSKYDFARHQNSTCYRCDGTGRISY